MQVTYTGTLQDARDSLAQLKQDFRVVKDWTRKGRFSRKGTVVIEVRF